MQADKRKKVDLLKQQLAKVEGRPSDAEVWGLVDEGLAARYEQASAALSAKRKKEAGQHAFIRLLEQQRRL